VFGGKWYCLDQLLMSSGLLTGDLRYVEKSLAVFGDHTVPNLAGGKPIRVRTHRGNPKSFGGKSGSSDHLPIVWQLTTG